MLHKLKTYVENSGKLILLCISMEFSSIIAQFVSDNGKILQKFVIVDNRKKLDSYPRR